MAFPLSAANTPGSVAYLEGLSRTSDSFLGRVDVTNLHSSFSEEEKQTALKVRAFVDSEIRPNIAEWFDSAHFPREIIDELGKLGVLGMYICLLYTSPSPRDRG